MRSARLSTTGLAVFLLAGGALVPLACSSSGSTPPPLTDTGVDAGPVVHYDASPGTGGHDAAAHDAAAGSDATSSSDSGGDGPSSATCSDGVQNENETDIDCGGGTCPACADTKHCKATTDCVSQSCSAAGADAGSVGVCVAATCQDHIKNGTESDIDCGGSACPPCLAGKRCGGTADCKSALCTASTCVCPDGMVTMPTALALGGSYCIDATEVTRAEYNAFWTANPNLGGNLPANCSTKQSYTPSNEWPPTLTTNGYNGGFPVRYVDWCDAYSYCRWKNKRLCGAIQGGSSSAASASDRLVDAFYNACTAEGANVWPYGPTYRAGACNGADAAGDAGPATWNDRSQTGSIDNTILTSCQGGASGLYNMSGNVAEWEDACDATNNCLVRGGSYASSPTELRCDNTTTAARLSADATIGFRCCL